MGILSRFTDIMKANINAALDKCENPAKMVDQTLRDLREDLAEVKKETAAVMANEKSAARKVSECEADIQKYTTAAQNALKSGNEDDARKLISKKQQYEAQLTQLKTNYDVAHSNAEKMRQMHDKLVADIDELESRRETIKAKVATAKAQEHMNKINTGANTSASISAFERMEAKADKMLDAANAEADLNAGVSSASDLAEKYSSGCDSTVDDELAKMKADLGLGSDT